MPALTADPRFRDSMRLITQCSLLPFMTPQQFYYPRVVLQFYHSMTSRERRVRLSSDSVLMIDREYSERQTFQLHWACRQSRPILEVIGIGLSRHIGRWSVVSLETLLQGQYSSGGSSRLKCFSLITCSGPASSRYSTTSSVGEPYTRLCTRSQRDSGSAPLSWL